MFYMLEGFSQEGMRAIQIRVVRLRIGTAEDYRNGCYGEWVGVSL